MVILTFRLVRKQYLEGKKVFLFMLLIFISLMPMNHVNFTRMIQR